MFVLAGFPIAVPSGFEFHRAQRGVLQAEYHNGGCAHAVPSWINTLFYSVFAILSHFLPSLTSSLPFTPSSTQCRTMMTTTLPHKITTHWTILLQPPPTTLSLPPPVHQKGSKRPVANGLTTKSSSSSTTLNQIALWQLQEASPWRNPNSTRLMPP